MKQYFIGGGIFVIGIILATLLGEAHFYTFFSIGLFIIFLEIYKEIAHKKLFTKWTILQYSVFWGVMLLISIVIDIIGIKLGYWHYPAYTTLGDNIVKYIFEWCIPLVYVMLGFCIGVAILKKHHVRDWLAKLGALAFFVIPLGFITEYFNHVAPSWVVTSMPFSNYQMNGYFIVFQTLGYWLIALIPWIIYKLITRLHPDKKHHI